MGKKRGTSDDFKRRMGICIICKKKIETMVQKNTGYCCGQCEKARAHE